jgi:hypothetical protein
MRPVLRFCIGLLALAACGPNKHMAQIDGVTLPECDETVAAPDGPVFAFWAEAHEEQYPLPKAPVIRIAADRAVSWRRVKQVADRIRAQGSTPVFLCGVGMSDKIAAFDPVAKLQPGPHFGIRANLHGELYVDEPYGTYTTHVQSFDNEHIAKSFIREAMTPLVAKYNVHDVEVHVDPHLQWADMIRAVDGSRTCCPGVAMRASLIE